jgi:hypothetical protein
VSTKPLADVVPDGDTRASLEALRDYLADALDSTASPREQAPLAARLESVLLKLDDLKKGGDDDSDGLFGAAPAVGSSAPGAGS